MIVIPDIHGRTFWKDAVKGRENEKIIFLGDFLDPYPDENISYEDAVENFKEIIEFKKQHDGNVIILFGNHDGHYSLSGFEDASRYCRNRELAKEIKEIYKDNMPLFKLVHEETINGKRFIFSHSGIHKLWLDDVYGIEFWDEVTAVEQLNKYFQEAGYRFVQALNDVSYYRGGWESYGSIVWADVREFDLFKKPCIGDYMVFGHTQLMKPVVTEYAACLDCRRGFLINELGKICEIDGAEVPLYGTDKQ